MIADAELVLLRSFYAAWTSLHSLPRDRLHRSQQEQSAQELVDAHHALRELYLQHSRLKPAAPANEEEAHAGA